MDPRKQAKRRKRLKIRQAAEQRKLDRQEADYFHYLAMVDFSRGNAPGALRNAKKAIGFDPHHGPSLDLLGRIYFEHGQYPDAAYYLRILRKHHQNPIPIYNCGMAHMKMGRPEEALADLREFLDVSKGSRDAQVAALRDEAFYWCSQLT